MQSEFCFTYKSMLIFHRKIPKIIGIHSKYHEWGVKLPEWLSGKIQIPKLSTFNGGLRIYKKVEKLVRNTKINEARLLKNTLHCL